MCFSSCRVCCLLFADALSFLVICQLQCIHNFFFLADSSPHQHWITMKPLIPLVLPRQVCFMWTLSWTFSWATRMPRLSSWQVNISSMSVQCQMMSVDVSFPPALAGPRGGWPEAHCEELPEEGRSMETPLGFHATFANNMGQAIIFVEKIWKTWKPRDISIDISIGAHHSLHHIFVMSSGVPLVQELLPAKPHRLHSATADRSVLFGGHVPGQTKQVEVLGGDFPSNRWLCLKRHMGNIGYMIYNI